MVYGFDAATGKLAPVAEPWMRVQPGAGPRHISFHPSGRYASVINELDSTVTAFAYDGAAGTLQALQMAANQATGTVVTFRTDPPTGRLEPAGRIAVPSPVCLRFLRV